MHCLYSCKYLCFNHENFIGYKFIEVRIMTQKSHGSPLIYKCLIEKSSFRIHNITGPVVSGTTSAYMKGMRRATPCKGERSPFVRLYLSCSLSYPAEPRPDSSGNERTEQSPPPLYRSRSTLFSFARRRKTDWREGALSRRRSRTSKER